MTIAALFYPSSFPPARLHLPTLARPLQDYAEYLTFDDNDGVFWMSWKDFGKKFDNVVLCRRDTPIEFDKGCPVCAHCGTKITDNTWNVDSETGAAVKKECWDEYAASN